MFHGVRGPLLERPMNVEEIVRNAKDSFFDPQFSMKNWFRTAELMLTQANIYEREGNDQMAYLFLYRHANLIVNDLPKHSNADDPQYRGAWTQARRSVNRSLAKLEELKPRINRRHEQHEVRKQAKARQLESLQRQQNAQLANGARRTTSTESAAVPQSGQQWRSPSPERMDPTLHKDAAVRLANNVIRRRTRRGEARLPEGLGAANDTASRMMEARRQLESTERTQNFSDRAANTQRPSNYQYPHVPEKSARGSSHSDPRQEHRPPSTTSRSGPALPQKLPVLPSKEPLYPSDIPELHAPSPVPPPLPQKTFDESSITPPVSRPASTAPSPVPAHQFATSSFLENGVPLRTIYLPSPLRHDFLKIAHRNTSQNLETCGVLCGTLLQNALFITKLVIPEQESTSDTCEMVNEAALYEYCDAQPEELMVLGWIHTHPTQTCFMSSRDLHTHCWYQVQLPESIAIVCSPSKDPDWGIFRLTDPPGMGAIRTCKLSGIFHPHAETHIFTDALGRPGHVIEHKDLHYDVVDLRGRS